MSFVRSVMVGFVTASCASSPAAPPAASAPSSEVPASAAESVAVPSSTTARELPELQATLEAEGVSGSITLLDTDDPVPTCSKLEHCRRQVIPASTFKIPHSMIALETGVVEGPDTVLRWDGKQYLVDAWNQDLSVRDAFRVSCVPCYQGIARKVGEPREREWLEKLGYGNRDVSGGVDRFWLFGGLRISPLEQVEFLRRFDENQLPVSERTADIVRDIMALDVTERYVLRAKTGSAMPPDQPMAAFWFVGWLELGERRIYFATLLDGARPDVDLQAARRAVTEKILKSRGLM
jgi:beta-lactamase class D